MRCMPGLFVSNSLGMLRYLAFLPPAETKSVSECRCSGACQLPGWMMDAVLTADC
jgi:hypothetical protein